MFNNYLIIAKFVCMTPISILLIIGATVVTFFMGRLLAHLKGNVGEGIVSSKLSRLPKEEYCVFNDVILSTPKGSTQIDHIVVSLYGVFVIETKNYKGWVYGSEKSEYWTQNVYGHKYKLYNPIFQNEGHVRALRRVLSENKSVPFFSIIAFSGRADVKVSSQDTCLVYWGGIRRVIKGFNHKCLDWNQVAAICNEIRSARLESSREVRKQHRQDVKKAQLYKDIAVESGYCPRCGGKLVLRTGKYGQFLGCSNYPKCKYVKSLS